MDTIRNKSYFKFIMGPIQMIFSAVFFALMSFFAKKATYTIPSNEVAFFRLLIGVLVTLVLVRAIGVRLITENLKLLVVRGFFGGLAVLVFFMAIEKGTITNSVVLQNTYPIFAAVIALFVLKERITLKILTFMAVTFIGIFILVRPSVDKVSVGDIFAIVSALLGGFAITAVRQLRQKNESVWTIFFYFCIFGAVISFILALPEWKWPDMNESILVILTGMFGLMGQVSMTSAYKYCSTSIGGILSMSTCVFSFILGVTLLNENFIMLDIVGVFLIIGGNVLAVIFEGEKKKIPETLNSVQFETSLEN